MLIKRLTAAPQRNARLLVAALLLGAGLSAASSGAPAQAQDKFSAVVKVNDAIITGYDIEQRAQLMSLGAGGGGLGQFISKAKKALVIEELKLQEAERSGLTLTDEALQRAMSDVAKRNKTSLDGLFAQLANANIERETFERQIRADMLWGELLRRRYGSRAQPDDTEVDSMIATLGGEVAHSYHMAQLLLPLKRGASEADFKKTQEHALSLRAELKSCADVMARAKDYGRGSGDIGKVTLQKMPPPVRAGVKDLAVGEVAQPIRSNNGLHVIMLCGKEAVKGAKVDRERIFTRLREEKMSRFADSYLQDLQRHAMIESKN